MTAEPVAKGGKARRLQRGRGNDVAVNPRQVARGRRGRHDGRLKAEVERAARRRVDAHMRHEPGEDHIRHGGRAQVLLKVGLDERVRKMLGDDRLAGLRRDLVADLLDRRRNVVGRPWAGIVPDVEDRDAGVARPRQQTRGFGHGRLDAGELHRARAIRVLAVDHHQRRLAQRGRLVRKAGNVTQCPG